MSSTPDRFPQAGHDWHSPEYVEEWISRDEQRQDERQALLKQMLSLAPFPANEEVDVLDVGGGYGVVTREVLRSFPQARVALQDYSEEMLARARRRLSGYGSNIRFLQCDLRQPSWKDCVGGPFDLVVSAIALHNLRDIEMISHCYRAIHGLLKPGGNFLNCDHFHRVGGVEAHLKALEEAGFERVELVCQVPRTAIIRALGGGAPPQERR